jgi:cbb3-type cytochrome oxidase maturation protein
VSLTWFLFLLCLVMGLAAWTVFYWSVRTGQFRDAEAAAAEMLELDRLDGTSPSGNTGPAEPSAREIRERVAARHGRDGEEDRG